jgi:hypothetical protein
MNLSCTSIRMPHTRLLSYVPAIAQSPPASAQTAHPVHVTVGRSYEPASGDVCRGAMYVHAVALRVCNFHCMYL